MNLINGVRVAMIICISISDGHIVTHEYGNTCHTYNIALWCISNRFTYYETLFSWKKGAYIIAFGNVGSTFMYCGWWK